MASRTERMMFKGMREDVGRYLIAIPRLVIGSKLSQQVLACTPSGFIVYLTGYGVEV